MAQKMVIDFSQVTERTGFSPKHKPEGEYLGEVVSFTDGKSKADNAMWTFGVALKNDRRAVYPVYCVLNPQNAWKLRQFMMGCGLSVPKKKMIVDGNRLIGKLVGICLEDDEHEGKMKSVINSFFPASEYEGPEGSGSDDEGDEEPTEDEEYAEEGYEDEESLDDSDDSDDVQEESDEGTDEDEEQDEEPPAKPAKKAAKKKPAPEPVDEEDDEDEDEMDVDAL